MALDERDYLDAQSVGIPIGDVIPEEFIETTREAGDLCRKCNEKCDVYGTDQGITMLRIATGRLVEFDCICNQMKNIVMKNRYKVIGG